MTAPRIDGETDVSTTMTYLEEGVENTTLYNYYDDDPVDIDIANRVISLNSYGFPQVSWRQ